MVRVTLEVIFECGQSEAMVNEPERGYKEDKSSE